MKQSIGFTQSLSIIIIFILIVFALLSATLSYYKAFKINSYITSIVQKYEGYNSLSEAEINQKLTSMGYRFGSVDCPKKKGHDSVAVVKNREHAYCIYAYDDPKEIKNGYYRYGVLTYIFVELPLGYKFKLPVYSETEPIYRFNG